jgi:hypothetical protein
VETLSKFYQFQKLEFEKKTEDKKVTIRGVRIRLLVLNGNDWFACTLNELLILHDKQQ